MIVPTWIDWTEAPPKGDAADFVALGGDQATLQDLLDHARPFDSVDDAGTADEASDTEPWRPPVPFDAYAVPSFPVLSLPAWLGDVVGAQAIATQTPPDL